MAPTDCTLKTMRCIAQCFNCAVGVKAQWHKLNRRCLSNHTVTKKKKKTGLQDVLSKPKRCDDGLSQAHCRLTNRNKTHFVVVKLQMCLIKGEVSVMRQPVKPSMKQIYHPRS